MKLKFEGDIIRIDTELNPKEAANPECLIGALVKLTNGMDMILVVDEDVYVLQNFSGQSKHMVVNNPRKLDPEMAQEIVKMLRVKEKDQ